jgi:hypothetical protein
MSGDVHKWLFDALGDKKAVTEAGDAGWLTGPRWGEAIEQVRLTRYGTLSPEEGSRRLGFDIGKAFLDNDIGTLVRETLPLLDLDRVGETLLPVLMSRLRRPFETTWERTETGGIIRVTGPMANRPEITLGFFEAMLAIVHSKPTIALTASSPTYLEFKIERSIGR